MSVKMGLRGGVCNSRGALLGPLAYDLKSSQFLGVDNAGLAHAFWELAELLEISGEPQFRVRAFRNAARAIENLSEPAAVLLGEGRLLDVPNIGAGIARRVAELIA